MNEFGDDLMKRFTVPCNFGSQKAPFHVYIGKPLPDNHPLKYQEGWLRGKRGGTVPQEVMDAFERLHRIALENNVSFEDLCVYALGSASEKAPTDKNDKE